MFRKLFFAIVFIFLVAGNAHSQESCGTEYNAKVQKYLEDNKEQMDFYQQQYLDRYATGLQTYSNTLIPIKAHILRTTSGTGGLTTTQLNDAIVDMNLIYTGSGLEFFLCDGINYINDSNYYDFDGNDESAMTSQYNESGMVNIYFANTVTSRSGSSLCGYAYYPGGPETILMNNSCATNGSTLSHEVGHFFALVHTHGGSNTPGSTGELVDGSNCSTTGDFVCDTPADPQLGFSNVNSSCNYTGSDRDANRQLYVPDPTNIMSYSRKSCRTVLTTQQFARAYAAYQTTNRNNLDCPNQFADFTADVTQSCQPNLTVSFTDNSINAISWAWDVDGNGTIDYTTQNVTHTYNTPGNYTVSLTVSDGTATDTMTRDDYIQVTSSQMLTDSSITFELTLDNYPDETTWTFVDGSGAILNSGGPYSRTLDANTTKTETFNLTSDSCYTFIITDSFDDGICCNYGNGSYSFKGSDGTVLASGGNFATEDRQNFATGTLNSNEVSNAQIVVFPNPTREHLTIKANQLIEQVTVYNAAGQQVMTQNGESANTLLLDVRNLPTGVFFIKSEIGADVITGSFIKK